MDCDVLDQKFKYMMQWVHSKALNIDLVSL